MDTFLDKKTSKILYGIAIILMVCHHVLNFPDRFDYKYQYMTAYMLNHHNIEFYIGSFGKLCVGIYAFISGYGLAVTIDSQKI